MPAAAECTDYALHPHLVANLPSEGSSVDIELVGDLAYVARGNPGPQIFDISVPGDPVLLTELNFIRSCTSLEYRDGYLFTTTRFNGLIVTDVSDPTAPQEAAAIDPDYSLGQLVLHGDVAYAAAGSHGVHVFDVSDPRRPQSLGTLALPASPRDLACDGNRLVATLETEGVALVDVSMPAAPMLMGVQALSGSVFNVDMVGDIAWVVHRSEDLDHSLMAMRIDTFNSFDIVGEIATEAGGGVVIDGTTVYLIDYSAEILVIDGTDPTEPRLLNRIAVPYGPVDVAAAPGRLLVANGYSGFSEVAFTTLEAPTPASVLELGGDFLKVRVTGGEAFMGHFSAGVHWLDLDDPESPAIVATIPTLTPPMDMVYDAPYLYVAAGAYFLIMDVTDPDDPQIVSGLNLVNMGYSSCGRIEMEGSRAYLRTHDGLLIVDVSDLSVPHVDGYLEVRNEPLACTLVLDWPLAYLGDNERNLHTLNVADPNQPVILNSVALPADIAELAREGSTIVVACTVGYNSENLTVVVDITTPAQPLVRSMVVLPGEAHDVALRDGIAYVSCEDAGLHLVDVTDPFDAHRVGAFQLDVPADSHVVGLVPGAIAVGFDDEGLVLVWPHCGELTAAPADPDLVPAVLTNLTCWPNPFNPATTIAFELSHSASVTLRIFDLRGRLVREMISGERRGAGRHQIVWRGRDDLGRGVAAGRYHAHLEWGGRTVSRALMLVR